jgi:hypothetical protein
MNGMIVKFKCFFVSSIILIFIVKGMDYFVFPEQGLSDVKAFCTESQEIKSIAGDVESVTLSGRTKYMAAPDETSHIEYRVNIYGKIGNVFAVIRVEYPDGFDSIAREYKILEIVQP